MSHYHLRLIHCNVQFLALNSATRVSFNLAHSSPLCAQTIVLNKLHCKSACRVRRTHHVTQHIHHSLHHVLPACRYSILIAVHPPASWPRPSKPAASSNCRHRRVFGEPPVKIGESRDDRPEESRGCPATRYHPSCWMIFRGGLSYHSVHQQRAILPSSRASHTIHTLPKTGLIVLFGPRYGTTHDPTHCQLLSIPSCTAQKMKKTEKISLQRYLIGHG